MNGLDALRHSDGSFSLNEEKTVQAAEVTYHWGIVDTSRKNGDDLGMVDWVYHIDLKVANLGAEMIIICFNYTLATKSVLGGRTDDCSCRTFFGKISGRLS